MSFVCITGTSANTLIWKKGAILDGTHRSLYLGDFFFYLSSSRFTLKHLTTQWSNMIIKRWIWKCYKFWRKPYKMTTVLFPYCCHRPWHEVNTFIFSFFHFSWRTQSLQTKRQHYSIFWHKSVKRNFQMWSSLLMNWSMWTGLVKVRLNITMLFCRLSVAPV